MTLPIEMPSGIGVMEYWAVGNTINQGFSCERFLQYSRYLPYEEKTSKVFEGDSSKSGRLIFYSWPFFLRSHIIIFFVKQNVNYKMEVILIYLFIR